MMSRLHAARYVGRSRSRSSGSRTFCSRLLEARLLDQLHLGRVGVDDGVGEDARTPRRGRGASSRASRAGRGSASLLVVGVRGVLRRQHPLRRALEQRELPRPGRRSRRRDLHRGRAGADHADPGAVERRPCGPSGRCGSTRPAKSSRPSMSGYRRVVQHAGGGDDDVGVVAVPGARSRGATARRASSQARHLVAEADPVVDARARRRRPRSRRWISGPGREPVAPVRVQGERVGVEVRRHVAGEARVGVLAPRAADAVGLLVDGEVVVAGLAQLDRAEDPGHARADDRDAQLAVVGGPGHGRTVTTRVGRGPDGQAPSGGSDHGNSIQRSVRRQT